ncbi:MAG: LysE family translocator [Amphritea sp.]|nr:LysE family translocator [Amphritea sp.]
MVEILLYAFGIMYTPGPANLLSLNAGINGEIRNTLRFCMGVACAMFMLFLLFGYTGALLVTPNSQLVISLGGSLYITYLAFKIARESKGMSEEFKSGQVETRQEEAQKKQAATKKIGFRSGLMLQLLNPKAFVAILPIVSVQFPAAQISGASILIWSLLLACLAFGAPGSYLLMGSRLRKLISRPRYFRLLNFTMALLLLYVAVEIAYSQVYLHL